MAIAYKLDRTECIHHETSRYRFMYQKDDKGNGLLTIENKETEQCIEIPSYDIEPVIKNLTKMCNDVE